MANIINNNFNFYKLKPYRGEYWDLNLNRDMNQYGQCLSKNLNEQNLIAYFDFSNINCFSGNNVVGLSGYSWDGAYSTNHVLENVGYTGFDNGLLYFEKDKIRNEDFLDLYQNSKYDISENDIHLKMHFVTGSTIQYSYDYQVNDDSINLNGGFLQGFFKTECGKFETLPSSFKNGDCYSFEFVLKPSSFEKKGGKLNPINEKYPNNKGIFFYVGTRSENKWIYLYDHKENEISYGEYIEEGEIDVRKHKLTSFIDMGVEMDDDYLEKMFDDYIDFDADFGYLIENSENQKKCKNCSFFGDEYLDDMPDCNCEFNYVEDELDISDFVYQTSEKDFTIGVYEDYADFNNPFILLNRTSDGFNVSNWEKDNNIRYVWERTKENKENLFLLMNRTSTGHTVNTIEEYLSKDLEEYDVYADLYENALAFRVTDSGEIGYRYLIKNCDRENKIEIVEGYSKKNLVKKDEWNHIFVKVEFLGSNMRFKFYLNGNLVFISKLLPKLNFRQLDEIYEKQETVPFNISLGGGTQGLSETILPNYMLNPYRTYPLEENFGGTFIGSIKTFRIYFGDVNYEDIINNFHYEIRQLL